jgi:hypothetical protein
MIGGYGGEKPVRHLSVAREFANSTSMNPIRRELLNGLFVLVVASLMSTAVAAFQVNFNLQLWTLIVLGVAVAVSGYVVFEFVLSADDRERTSAESTRRREEEWLKRVGTPARLELDLVGGRLAATAVAEAVKAISPGGDYTVMFYYGSEGGREQFSAKTARETIFSSVLERVKHGTLREYKRIICFDNDVLANDHELKSGILRVGEGPGTIDREMGDHCRLMMETKGCSLYVAPAVLRSIVALHGVDKASFSVETFDQGTGGRRSAGILIFSDPPNGEIIEQFRQMERATERRMVAVHKIRFPEDAEPTADLAAR